MPTPRTSIALRLLSTGLSDPAKNLSIGIGSPKPPAWLPREAKAEWRRIIEVCSHYPVWLQHADRAALVAYCVAWATYRAAAEQVAKDGPLVPGRSPNDHARGGLVKHPGLQVLRDQGEAMRRWSREFGFTPDSRQRITIGPDEEPDDGGLWD